ncbi:hypothetical protein KFU94_02570 [Chloroflexi bacterium TSY]|nr:hypothetical protein [Chloroflexi bacterium TSY]
MHKLFELITILFVLILAAYLRLGGVENSLGWYADEGTHVEIAKHLARGHIQYMVVTESTLLFAKLPLFEHLLSWAFRIWQADINVLRALSGTLGVITVGLLYVVVRITTRLQLLALFAALLLALYPRAVLYSRFGFSYNLLAPIVVLVYLGLYQYVNNYDAAIIPPKSSQQHQYQRNRKQFFVNGANSRSFRWLAFTALTIGVGGLSDLWMFLLIVPVTLIVVTCVPHHLLWSTPLMFVPFSLYAALAFFRTPDAFLFDLHYTTSRLTSTSISQQILQLGRNYMVLTTQDQWIGLALVGMFLLRPISLQLVLLLLFLMPILILGRSEALYSLSFYYMIPLLPLVSLGVASLFYTGLPFAWKTLNRIVNQIIARNGGLFERIKSQFWFRFLAKMTIGLSLIGIVGGPFLVSTADLVAQSQNRYHTEIDPFLLNPVDARQVVAYINEHTASTDLIIASPGIAWAIDAQVADFQMIAAVRGIATPHLPSNIPSERFTIQPRIEHAHFVVVDNTWHTWAIYHVPGVAEVLAEVSNWPQIFEAGAIQVYLNPR